MIPALGLEFNISVERGQINLGCVLSASLSEQRTSIVRSVEGDFCGSSQFTDRRGQSHDWELSPPQTGDSPFANSG
jgi:hypothetical protein